MSNWHETDIFHATMRRKRMFSENIPLLYIADRKTPEKYMLWLSFGAVFPMKNITSGLVKNIKYCLENICFSNILGQNDIKRDKAPPQYEKKYAIYFSSLFCYVWITKYEKVRAKMRSNHLVLFLRHGEKGSIRCGVA